MPFPVPLILLILGGTVLFVYPRLPESLTKHYHIAVSDTITKHALPIGTIILIVIVLLLIIFWR